MNKRGKNWGCVQAEIRAPCCTQDDADVLGALGGL